MKYVCALLEGLCGATYEEIVADYLITYYNYYAKAFSDYLLSHGMSRQQIDALIQAMTVYKKT